MQLRHHWKSPSRDFTEHHTTAGGSLPKNYQTTCSNRSKCFEHENHVKSTLSYRNSCHWQRHIAETQPAAAVSRGFIQMWPECALGVPLCPQRGSLGTAAAQTCARPWPAHQTHPQAKLRDNSVSPKTACSFPSCDYVYCLIVDHTKNASSTLLSFPYIPQHWAGTFPEI